MSLKTSGIVPSSDLVFSHFFESSPHGLSIVRPDLSIVTSNSRAQKIVDSCKYLKFTADDRVYSECGTERENLRALAERVSSNAEDNGLTVVSRKNRGDQVLVELSVFRCEYLACDSDGFESRFLLMRFFNSEYQVPLSARYMSYLHHLTPAEQHVLSELLSGKSNHAIAAIRGVSSETIKVQVRSITEKIGITNRPGLMLEAMKYNAGLPV